MELSCDWVAYQEMFRRRSRGAASSAPGAQMPSMTGPAAVIVENGIVVEAYAEGEDLGEWLGVQLEEVRGYSRKRELRVFSRSEVEAAMERAIEIPQFHVQIGLLKSDALPEGAAKVNAKDPLAFDPHPHFLVEALKTGWNRILPSSYALFIRVEGPGTTEQDFIMVVRRGELAGFHRPDLSFLGADRRRQPAHVVKYLSEKYLLPIQGIFVPSTEWSSWMESESPWKQLALAVRTDRARLVPFRWGVMMIAATRAFVNF